MKSIFSRTFFTLLTMAFLSPLALADDDDLAVNEVEGSLSVMVLGSGGPIATAEGRASAGYLIFTDGKPRILMDVGGGTFQRLAKSGTNIKDLDIILLSHLHADHTGDLTPVIKTLYFHNNLAGTGRTAPVRIYGPAVTALPHDDTGKVTYPNGLPVYPSTADYVDGHYSISDGGVERYLTAFVKGISGGASNFSYTANDLSSRIPNASIETLLDEGGLVIKSIAVDHGPVPAVAFRVEYKGHSIVYSGDTGTKGIGPNNLGQGNMATISQEADILIYDTAVMEVGDAPPNPLFHLLHTQPSLIANVAIEANVKKLVLSHLTPVTSPRVKEIKKIIKRAGFKGKIKSAKDLKVYNLGDDD
ncbi:MAG: MBL fold metallo-hydrolase [Arenicellales bacterium]